MSEEQSTNDWHRRYVEGKRNDPRATADLINQALKAPDRDDEAYWEAVNVLWYRANPDTLEVARRLCLADITAERTLGADILGQLGAGGLANLFHEERLSTLLTLLEQEQEPEVLSTACIALGHLYDAGAHQAIMRLKDHPHEDVRYGVAVGLTGDLDDVAIAALIELTRDQDSDVRDWATFRLGMLETDTPEIRDALAANLADEDEDTCAEAIVGLARKKDQRALEPLIRELDQLCAADQDWWYIADLLYEAASELADPRLCPVLLRIKTSGVDDDDLEEALQSCKCEKQ